MSEKDHLIEEWWVDWQIELVIDAAKIWTLKTFQTTSGFWTQTEGGALLGKTSQHEDIPPDAIIDEKAWDHEHCRLCWETISDKVNFKREGYTDGNYW